MKKTLTVNLGGTVYNIDEDAYYLLDNYLNNLRYHFRNNPEGEEIVNDMETRIAELFDDCIRSGRQVITSDDVEKVIARMGKPEDLNDGENEPSEDKNRSEKKVTRRLFRNPDDKVLGGVMSGLAAYFGWEVVALRLLMIVAGCFFQWLLLVYLVAWIVTPLARTATEKLQMRGEPINMENIGRTVTGGFEKKSGRQPRQSVWYKIGCVIIEIIGLVLKLCLLLFVICCFPALFIVMIIAFTLFLCAVGLLASVPSGFLFSSIDWGLATSFPGTACTLSVCALLLVGIPIAGLVQLLMQVFGNWKPMPVTAKIILMLLWLFALIVGVIVYVYSPFIGIVML